MYGSNYKPVESIPTVDAGIYTAKIVKVETINGNYGEQKKLEVVIKGHNGCSPKYCFLNDQPSQPFGNFTLEQAQEMWNRNMTRFFDSFKIQRGNFNTNTWVGAVGTITVRPQKKNPQYMEIVPYEVKENHSAPAPQQAAAPAAAPQPAQQFNEDIPF